MIPLEGSFFVIEVTELFQCFHEYISVQTMKDSSSKTFQLNQCQECVKPVCIDEVIQSLAAKLTIAHKPNI